MSQEIELRYEQKVYYLNSTGDIIEGRVTSARGEGNEIEVSDKKDRVWMLSKDVYLDKKVLVDFVGNNGYLV